MDAENKLKIPSPSRMQRLTELLTEDDDFRFPTIKLHRDKPRYELPAPTRDDPDNIENASTFRAVVLVARKNFYQSDEDKEAGKEPKEKRALYVLRLGRITPELIYISPTSVKNWKIFVKQCVQGERRYWEVLVEFSAEKVKGKQFTWNKVNFKQVRSLAEDELEHVQEIRNMVDARVSVYEDESELDKVEEEALNEGRRAKATDEEPEVKHSRRAAAQVEEDDDPEPPKKTAKKSSKPADDDDDDAPPKKAKKAAKPADDDDDDAPPSKGRAGYPSLDDDDDDD